MRSYDIEGPDAVHAIRMYRSAMQASSLEKTPATSDSSKTSTRATNS
jgi:hypothetical protein